MRTLILAAVSVLALSACDDDGIRISKHTSRSDVDAKALKVVTQLQCPEHQGSLTRVATAPDGLSCDYAGPRGAEVTLRLVKFDDSPDEVLSPLESDLNRLLPDAVARLAAAQAKAQAAADQGRAEADRAEAQADRAAAAAERAADRAADHAEAIADRAEAAAERRAARAEARAERAADRERDRAERDEDVDLNLPGLTVKTEGEHAKVRLPGIHIDADDAGAHVKIGGVRIDAEDGPTDKVKVSSPNGEEVNIRSEDDASEIRSRKAGAGVRATYILVDDRAPADSWRLVGYEARGPAKGPLVVAVVKSKSRHDDPVFNAAKALVKSNAGG